MADTWYFDGGCRPNPGAMEIAVVHGAETFVRIDIGIGDSSEAEWRALLFAIELARAADAKDVRFIGDNAMVVAQAGGKAACRARLKPLLVAFRSSTADFDRVQVRHVARSKNPAGTALARRVR
jgi:ribonuclease HI